MADAMREKVARKMFKQDHDEPWAQGEARTKLIYLNNASAALKARCFEELVFKLNTIAGFPKAAEETGQNSDFVAGLELAASYARVALEKVEASHA